MPQHTRIIIADDHPIFRDGFKVLLQNQDDLQLIAEAEDGRQLVQMVEQFEPDLVFTDIKMPGMDGVEATRILSKKYPGMGIIALSMFNDDHLIMDMLYAGARGYLLKNTNKTELLEAAKSVQAGKNYYCSATSAKLARMIGESRFNPFQAAPSVPITGRELEIIQLICAQKSNKEIADQLGLSPRTVESHREHIIRKIGARNVTGIVLYAIKHQLIRMD
jgi:DNA-binding NarL/FixJ family response regulator